MIISLYGFFLSLNLVVAEPIVPRLNQMTEGQIINVIDDIVVSAGAQEWLKLSVGRATQDGFNQCRFVVDASVLVRKVPRNTKLEVQSVSYLSHWETFGGAGHGTWIILTPPDGFSTFDLHCESIGVIKTWPTPYEIVKTLYVNVLKFP